MPARGFPPDQARANLEFAIDLIEMAERDGMAPYYAASRLAQLASGILKATEKPSSVPAALVPDDLARRILASFRFGREQAIQVAALLRAADDDEPANTESVALSEMKWVFPDLGMLASHLTDEALAVEARRWLDIVPLLRRVPQ